MEVSGIFEHFPSITQNQRLRYTQPTGHGNSKTTDLVGRSYSGTLVEKSEGISLKNIITGKKRIGSRFCNLRSNHYENLSNEKGISS